MRKLAIIGGLSLMTAGTSYMVWHPHAPQFAPGRTSSTSSIFGFSITLNFTEIKYKITAARIPNAHKIKIVYKTIALISLNNL